MRFFLVWLTVVGGFIMAVSHYGISTVLSYVFCYLFLALVFFGFALGMDRYGAGNPYKQ